MGLAPKTTLFTIYWTKLRNTWGRLPIWKQMVLFVLAVPALLILVFLYQMFGWYPGPRSDGVVTDRSTGRPVANAYVVVSIQVTRHSLLSSHTGCSTGSGVVLTDEQGRFEYAVSRSDAFRKPYPEHWSMNLSVYHPEYSMPAPAPHHRQFPEAWAVRSKRRDLRLEVVPKAVSAVERYTEIHGSLGAGCVGYSGVMDPKPLFRTIYREQWGLICGPSSDPAPLGRVLLWEGIRSLEESLAALTRPFPRSDEWKYEGSWRSKYVRTSFLGNYPWSPDAPDHGRPLTAQERAAVCDFYAPPAERVLAREKPP